MTAGNSRAQRAAAARERLHGKIVLDEATRCPPFSALIATSGYDSIILQWPDDSVLDDEISTLRETDAEIYELGHWENGLRIWTGTAAYSVDPDSILLYDGAYRRLTEAEAAVLVAGGNLFNAPRRDWRDR